MNIISYSSCILHFNRLGSILALYPVPFRGGGGEEEKAWYPLFAHVQDFLGIPRNSILQ